MCRSNCSGQTKMIKYLIQNKLQLLILNTALLQTDLRSGRCYTQTETVPSLTDFTTFYTCRYSSCNLDLTATIVLLAHHTSQFVEHQTGIIEVNVGNHINISVRFHFRRENKTSNDMNK